MKKFSEIEYKRPDVDGFLKVIEEASEQFPKLDLQGQVDLIKALDKAGEKITTAGTLAHIRYTIDTRDEFYKGEVEYFYEVEPKIEDKLKVFNKAVLDSQHRQGLEELFGKQIFNLYSMREKIFAPEIMEDLVEESKIANEYQDLIGSAQIDLDGTTYTLSRLRPLIESKDRETRIKASEAYFGFFEENVDKFDDIYDRLVKVRDRIAKKLGFDNFVDLAYLRMSRSDYGPKEVAAYREAIVKHVVPYATELRRRQEKRLGLDHLYYYDEALNFNSGNANPQGDPAWILDRGKDLYKALGPVTDEFFSTMVKYELFDLLSRDGKMAGGYCTSLDEYKVPFIFANLNGTAGDVEVLTHEAGHALQMYLARNQILSAYGFPTLEACEIHSMSMEFLSYPYIDLFFKEYTEKFKFAHMAGTMEFLPYGALVDHFQHFVYENVDATPAERRAKFRELEKIYLPHRDYGDNEFLENGGFFFKQGHIFQSPFYYIDYTLAQVCAIGFFKMSLEDHDKAMETYLDLCRLGGSKSFLDLVASTGLKNPFADGTMEEAVATIKSQLDKIDDSKF
ncbi:MAG: M3 family oligoendopeptidase [Bacillota bacterium]|nr:M3 family oligoendopeptidase [Bacillota bacterium]